MILEQLFHIENETRHTLTLLQKFIWNIIDVKDKT